MGICPSTHSCHLKLNTSHLAGQLKFLSSWWRLADISSAPLGLDAGSKIRFHYALYLSRAAVCVGTDINQQEIQAIHAFWSLWLTLSIHISLAERSCEINSKERIDWGLFSSSRGRNVYWTTLESVTGMLHIWEYLFSYWIFFSKDTKDTFNQVTLYVRSMKIILHKFLFCDWF